MKNYTQLNNYRYERKFVGKNISRSSAELIVRKNDAFFSSVFHPRQVNNIYFDTPGLDCYFDNLFGIGKRWKARVRWYENRFGQIESPVLEFKLKTGFTGTKKSFPLPGFSINENNFDATEWKKIFISAQLPENFHDKIKGMEPVLLNTYKRSYFASIDNNFRITVDDNLEYFNLRPTWNYFIHPYKELFKTVVELKYDDNLDSKADKITDQFPFRLDKNSKFVSGMSHFRQAVAE
jgi:hypothetical protein